MIVSLLVKLYNLLIPGRLSIKTLVALLLCILVPSTGFAADSGYKVVYDGGSIPDTKAGVTLHLHIDADQSDLRKKGAIRHEYLPRLSLKSATDKTCIGELVLRSDWQSLPLA